MGILKHFRVGQQKTKFDTTNQNGDYYFWHLFKALCSDSNAVSSTNPKTRFEATKRRKRGNRLSVPQQAHTHTQNKMQCGETGSD